MTKPNKTQVFSYALFALSAAVLFASFMLTMNITVLKDWRLSTPAADIHAGDTVTLVSQYTKVRNVTGKSVRYIECQNSQHIYIRYPLNEAVANRAAGRSGTGIVVKVPETIPNLPTTCKFTIAIEYDVYPWRKVNVSQSSNEFQLLPKRDIPQDVSTSEPSSTQIGQDLAQAPTGGQSLDYFSSSKTTGTEPPPQSDSPQPPIYDGMPTDAEQQLEPTPQPADSRSTLDKLPFVGGLFQTIGL